MAFRFDKLTIKAQEAIAKAQSDHGDGGNPEIDPLHLLAALLSDAEGIAAAVLERIGANRQQLERIVESELGHFPKIRGPARRAWAECKRCWRRPSARPTR